jgi:transketolase, N-subunit
MNIYPLKEKLERYNFAVHEIQGHNIEEILNLFQNNLSKDKSNIIIAKTIKGKGISFMENKNTWHRKSTK